MKATLLSLLIFNTLMISAQTPVKNFALVDVISGNLISLDSYASSPGVVVLFTGNECPFDIYYMNRLASLITKYSSRVPFLLVNAHLDPEDSEEKMKTKASSWPFRAPYLVDKDQVAMAALGARRTPEVFLLKSVKGNFEILYSGAIDDNPQEEAAVTSAYLRDAIENMLSGKQVAHRHVRASGCSIRKK